MALSDVLDWLQSLPQAAMLAGTGVLVAGEGIVGLGFVLPGEAALLLASAAVDSMPDFLALWAVATICSILGNVIGFELGRRVGPALRETKLVRKHGAERWDRATSLVREHGTRAVFLGRLIPFIRSFVPAVAGGAGMAFRRFLPAVAAGAAVATALPILFTIGVVAGVRSANDVVLIVIAGLLTALVVTVVVRKHRTKSRKTSLARGIRDEDTDPDVTPTR